MKERVGDRLPPLNDTQRNELKGSVDFFALNHYATSLARAPTSNASEPRDFFEDAAAWTSCDPSWPKGDSDWLSVVPWGMRRILRWVKDRWVKVGAWLRLD